MTVPVAAPSGLFVWNHRDLAVALKDRKTDLPDLENALGRARRLEDIVLIQACALEAFVEHPALFNYHGRPAIEHAGEPQRTLLDQ